MITVGFLGIGHMGGALLNGFVKAMSPDKFNITAYDTDISKLKDLAALGVTSCGDEAHLATSAQYIVVAVVPQILGEVLQKIKPAFNKETVIISVCAGVGIQKYRDYLGDNTKVVLAMPNTPAVLGQGSTAIARDSLVSDEEFAVCRTILGACGAVEEIAPDKMSAVIAVNSSAPAYIYLFVKGFADSAAAAGIDRDAALRMFVRNLTGAAAMIEDSGATVEKLIAQVSSPGGTTRAGLQVFEEKGLLSIIDAAYSACTKRAGELAELNSK